MATKRRRSSWTDMIHINPLLSLFGIRVFDVVLEGDQQYLVITRRNLVSGDSIQAAQGRSKLLPVACPQRQERRPLCLGHTGEARDVQALIAAIAPQRVQTCTATHLPQPYHPVGAAAGQQLSVARERHAGDRAGVPVHGGQELPARRLPQPYRPVHATASQQPAVPRERYAPDRDAVSLHGGQELSTPRLHQPHTLLT